MRLRGFVNGRADEVYCSCARVGFKPRANGEGFDPMKVAIAAEKEAGVFYVTEHFGHCASFILYQVENGEAKEVEEVENPGHQPGFLPEFLGGKGIDLVIAGGMGARAIELFNAKGIKVITGAAGEVSKVMADFAGGRLETSGSTCNH